MTGPRIGLLCSGYGGLDLAVMDAVPGAEIAWHAQWEPPDKKGREDKNQYPSQILAHRWPGVPNHGDITRADWFEVEPIDILTAGYPCQPISYAGKGLVTEDARWIWPAVAQAVRLLRPSLVYLENVSAHLLCGFTTVAANLAQLGYVGSWTRLRASDVGAPHQRERLFILARPADADPDGLRGQRRGPRIAGQPELAACGEPASNAARDKRDKGRPEPARILRGPDVALGSSATTTDFDSSALGTQRHGEAAQQEAHYGRHRLDASGRFLGWGPYGAAVRRWEAVLGQPAPVPTDKNGRLAPPFVEWVMGLPAGWVTDVPGIPRNAQLKALGNGVVPQQGAAAFRILAERLGGVR